MTANIINNITCGDCLEVLKQFPYACIDLVVTDCPYKIVSGGCTTGAYGNKKGCGKCAKKWETAGQMNDNYDNLKSGKMFDNNEITFSQWLPEMYRVLKDGSHCYIMINGRNLAELQVEAEKAGFKYQNLLVWNKGNSTPNRYYLNACEFILMLRKGAAKSINDMGTKNILSVHNIIGNKNHPTEKPVELMKIMIANSSNKGDIVLDPFAGTGATCVAAKELGRDFIGIEINEKYANIAKERITKGETNA